MPVPKPDFSNVMERGKYMTEVGGCIGCHTSWETQLKPGLFAGGMEFQEPNGIAYSANLTLDESGLTYDENTFINVIRTGKSGTLHSVMPWIVIKNYTDEDLRAIYKYLKVQKPVRHYVNNISEPTYCVLCGQKHGLGNKNAAKITKTADVKPEVYDTYAGTYTSNEGDSLTVFRDSDSLKVKYDIEGFTTKLLPLSNTEYASINLPFNMKFGLDKKTKAKTLTYHIFDDIECRKVK